MNKFLYIGFSNWARKNWHEKFYPRNIGKNYLNYYSKIFNTVEINNSFYVLPGARSFDAWREQAGEDFVFSVKLNRTITHVNRLKRIKTPLRSFIIRAQRLSSKLGPILVQLPTNLMFDLERLENFFKGAGGISGSENIRFALEPRHASWFEKENIASLVNLLRKHNAALVFSDSHKGSLINTDDSLITADFVYARLSVSGKPMSPKGIVIWAENIKRWLGKKIKVFIYFDSGDDGSAIKTAKSLKSHFK